MQPTLRALSGLGLPILLLSATLGSGQEGGVQGSVASGAVDETATDLELVRDYDEPPRPIKITQPQYPQEAFVKKIEGTVVVEIVVDARGRVVKTRVMQSVPALDTNAIECVKAWEFKPATKGGQPVATVALAPITFRIDKAKEPSIASAVRGYFDRFLKEGGKRDVPSGTGQQMAPLSFDPQGADFTLWVNNFKNEVYNNWIMPQPALLGAHGHVDFEFTVERDGTVSSIKVLKSAGESLDRAAENALKASRMLSLPADYGPPRVTMRVAFYYNEARPRPASPSPPN
jgi:TonB family protein